jgi:hypothetical protein
MQPQKLFVAALALFASAASPALAGIMAGPTVIDPPAQLGRNALGQDEFFAFYEKQNVVLDRAVKVDGGWIDAGTLVSSNYVIYDPKKPSHKTMTVTFDSPILGVITKDRRLKKSDFLGADGTRYKKFYARGREPRDKFVISADGLSITFKMNAGNPGDYMRVITRGSLTPPPPPPPPIDPPAVPEPGAAALFGLGAALVKLSAGRRRSVR